MARGKIPDPLARRHLLEREMAPAQAQRLADAYLEESRSLEAVEFLVKAEAGEELARLRREAVEGGDLFLLRLVARAAGEEPSGGEWMELAEAAEAAGKLRYAADARRQVDRGEE